MKTMLIAALLITFNSHAHDASNKTAPAPIDQPRTSHLLVIVTVPDNTAKGAAATAAALNSIPGVSYAGRALFTSKTHAGFGFGTHDDATAAAFAIEHHARDMAIKFNLSTATYNGVSAGAGVSFGID